MKWANMCLCSAVQTILTLTFAFACLHEDETLFTLSKVSKVSIMVQ